LFFDRKMERTAAILSQAKDLLAKVA